MRCLFVLLALTATAIARKPPFWDGTFGGERYVVVYGNIVCPSRPVCLLCGIGPEVFNSVSLQYRSRYEKEYRAIGTEAMPRLAFLIYLIAILAALAHAQYWGYPYGGYYNGGYNSYPYGNAVGYQGGYAHGGGHASRGGGGHGSLHSLFGCHYDAKHNGLHCG